MPKRKRINLVRVLPNNQIEDGLPSFPSMNNEVEPNQQPVSSGNNEAPSPPPKKPRGPTLMSYIWELEKGVKVNVIFDANCHPIGKEGCTLTRFLGIVARESDVTLISYKEWRDTPKIYKDDVEDY
ncbi:hypothetical protein SLEP1_g21586 [Rubroshorea leprosula]|uniref:Uncharacterized protein n=1 Tax=Rubroshorea leprosula TaxID=152421 RepID=A0AAV5J6E5_9ROSI|nr:hypothetical protein SLEP1_g21586 [Rubroshorea leprosula]